MDISSTNSSAATMSTADTNVSVKTQKTSSKDSSFKEELNKVEKKEDTSKNASVENKSEEKTQNSNDAKNDETVSSSQKENNDVYNTDLNDSLLISGEVNMSVQQSLPAHLKQASFLNENVQALINANRQLADVTLMAEVGNIQSKVDYTSVQMDSNDAKFFADLVQNSDKTLQNVVADLQGNAEQTVQEAAKNVKVSATLMNALSEAVKNNQSFRIDFDKDISVIIKVDKDGALSAKFIPGDKAVEEYLKQNISLLRQRFDEQELSYKDLSYSRQQQRQNQNRRNNKENEHE